MQMSKNVNNDVSMNPPIWGVSFSNTAPYFDSFFFVFFFGGGGSYSQGGMFTQEVFVLGGGNKNSSFL